LPNGCACLKVRAKAIARDIIAVALS